MLLLRDGTLVDVSMNGGLPEILNVLVEVKQIDISGLVFDRGLAYDLVSRNRDLMSKDVSSEQPIIVFKLQGSPGEGLELLAIFMYKGEKVGRIMNRIDLPIVDAKKIVFSKYVAVPGTPGTHLIFAFLLLDVEGNLWTVNLSEKGLSEGLTLTPVPLGVKISRMDEGGYSGGDTIPNHVILYDEYDNAFILIGRGERTPPKISDLYPFLAQPPQLLIENDLFSFYFFGYTALKIEGMFTLNKEKNLYYQNSLVAQGVEDFEEIVRGMYLIKTRVILLTTTGGVWSGELNKSPTGYSLVNHNFIGDNFSLPRKKGNRTKSARN